MRFLLLIPILLSLTARAQTGDLIQLSGMIFTSDSLAAVPFAAVRVEGTQRGTLSNYDGYFSLVVERSDTLVFTCVGYKPKQFVVPSDLDRTRYSIVQLLTRDTVHLDETVIYPWPTPGEFRDAFLALNIPDDDLERARRNLDRERLREISDQMGSDADEIQDYYTRQDEYKLYYYGQSPPINLLNPFAWAEFFKAWKRGDFRRD